MAEVTVTSGGRQVQVYTVAPAAQASAAAAAVVTGSGIDARPWGSVAYTVAVAAETIQWWVYGANASDYSDEVIVDGPSDVLAAAADSYAVAPAPYAYYRVKVADKVGGTHGTVTVRGIAKD
jgi:hypothetical protein